MTQDEIIRMARGAGLNIPDRRNDLWMPQLERFAALVAEATGIEQQREIMRLKAIIEEQANGAQNLVAAHERNRLAWTQEHWTEYEHTIAAAEREACAKVCEEGAGAYVNSDYTKGLVHGARLCAAAIRARGEK